MLQLFIHDEPKQMFFEDSENVLEYASMFLSIGIHTNDQEMIDMLKVNEGFSCSVDVVDDIILITGDEDYIEIKLAKVVCVNL